MEPNIQLDVIERERLAAIDEIVVTVNHKINNPLTIIINYAELLQVLVKAENQTKVIRGIKKILDAALKIKEITHNLSAIESSRKMKYIEDIEMIALSDDN